MKPDYGLELLRSGIDGNVSLNFYDVPFLSVDFLAPSSYSVMLEHKHAGKDYAVSFDFNDDVFALLISKIPIDLREQFGQSINGMSFPFSADLPLAVVVSVLECRLGAPQRGAHDSFVPLVVVAIS